MRTLRSMLPLTVLCLASACVDQTGQRNPFLTVTETFGTTIFNEDSAQTGVSAAADADNAFRLPLTVTLYNQEFPGELTTSWMAWVYSSSIRSADQQDALRRGGYVQLTSAIEVGSAYSLSAGTFVYNGPGVGGATPVKMQAATVGDNDALTPSEMTFEIITPDVLLFFSQPPVSCDTPAFEFRLDEFPLDVAPGGNFGEAYEGATDGGVVKTLAQFDVYECLPLRPGLFLRPGGGARQPNEFYEGSAVQVLFRRIADGDGNAAFVFVDESVVFTDADTSDQAADDAQADEQPADQTDDTQSP